jgi:hypothetical protein
MTDVARHSRRSQPWVPACAGMTKGVAASGPASLSVSHLPEGVIPAQAGIQTRRFRVSHTAGVSGFPPARG